MSEKAKERLKKVFNWVLGAGGTTVTVLTWEMLEETKESVIALGISSAIAGVALVFATQAIKVGLKKLIKVIYPFVKKLIYKKGNDKLELIKKLFRKKEKVKMTKSTLIQKILTTVLAVFGVGGVVVFFIPEFTGIATNVTKIVAMVSEAISVCAGIWLSTTSDKVLTAEEIEAEKTKKEAKEVKKAQALLEKYEKAKSIVEKSKTE